MPSSVEQRARPAMAAVARAGGSSARMLAARQDVSPVSAAMASQSTSCGADQDHRVVRGAAAERAARADRGRRRPAVRRSRRYFGSRSCCVLVGVVADEEVPAHRLVLGGEGVEGRHVVVVGQAIGVAHAATSPRELARIAARLEQQRPCIRPRPGARRACRRRRPSRRPRSRSPSLEARRPSRRGRALRTSSGTRSGRACLVAQAGLLARTRSVPK